jgi:nicotinate-nucleotide adenylyltransferase
LELGVFGGTFDPIHTGHLILAGAARSDLGLDEVLFVPAGQPWFRDGQQISAGHHRAKMVELALDGNPEFRWSEMEIRRPGPTYTVETLEALRRSDTGTQLHLILGTDALNEIARWHEPGRVLEMATLVAMPRPGHGGLDIAALETIRPGASDEVVMVDGPRLGISGAEIRGRVTKGLSIRYLVPRAVEDYIREHGLYRGTEGERSPRLMSNNYAERP